MKKITIVILMFVIIVAITLMFSSISPRMQEIFTWLEGNGTSSNSYQSERGAYPEPLSENDALYLDAKMYASKLGISVEEAVNRLKLQGLVGNINSELMEKESETFGGLWIQHKPDFHVIVLFTHDGEKTIKGYVQNTPLEAVVEVRTVDVSLEELKSEQKQVMKIMEGSTIPFMTGINVQENQVDLYVLDEGEVLLYLQEKNLTLPEHTQVIKVDELGNESNH